MQTITETSLNAEQKSVPY